MELKRGQNQKGRLNIKRSTLITEANHSINTNVHLPKSVSTDIGKKGKGNRNNR